MATTAGDIAVRVGADTSGLKKGLDDGERSLQSFASKAGAAAGKIATISAAALAAGAAIAASLTAKGFAAVDALDEMAEKSGTTAKSLQALQLSLGEAGISSDQTQAAIKKLNVAIGDAQAGNKTAQDTFSKLGLSVSELSGMDADARFAAIGDALAGYGDAADKASIATDLFGAKIGPELAVALGAGGDGIRQASKDLEAMGLAMDSVDAAQVANAMDAFGRAQMVIDGISNKLAVEFAPLLEAVSKSFIEAGKEGEGFGGAVSSSVTGLIKVIAFLANAIDGIKRIGTAVSDTLIYGFALVQESFLKLARSVISTLDAIPGIDLTANVVALEAKIQSAQVVMAEAAANIRRQFETPLAGDLFLKYAEDAKKASREGAEAAIAAREQIKSQSQTREQEPEAVDDKAAKKAADDILRAEATAAKLAETESKRIADSLARLDAQYMTEQEKLAAKLQEEQAIIQAALDARQITQDDADARELASILSHETAMSEIQKQEADRRTALAKAEADAKEAILKKAFGGLTSLMNSESRKMFEVGKAAAIGQSLIATYTGMTEALKLGWPLGPVAAAAIGAVGFQNVQAIRSQSFRGGGSGAASGGGSNTTAINAASQPVQQNNQPTQRTNITLIGEVFSRESVIGMLNSAMRDGYTLGA